MPVKYRSDQSETPCEQCISFQRGQSRKKYCGREKGKHINFITNQRRIKLFDTKCRYFGNKQVSQQTERKPSVRKIKGFTYPCISVWNPWAWAIPNALKNIENRTWEPRWKGKPLRGRILIHAAKKRITDYNWGELQALFKYKFNIVLPEMDQIHFGGIVGKADLVDCVSQSDSIWYEQGMKGWSLQKQEPIDFIPFRGQQGIFKYHSEVKL